MGLDEFIKHFEILKNNLGNNFIELLVENSSLIDIIYV